MFVIIISVDIPVVTQPRIADMYEMLGRFLKDLGLLSQVSMGSTQPSKYGLFNACNCALYMITKVVYFY